jgi:hypothetical protein
MEVDEAPAGFPHAEVDRHREELGRADEEQDSAKVKATLAVLVEEIAVHSRAKYSRRTGFLSKISRFVQCTGKWVELVSAQTTICSRPRFLTLADGTVVGRPAGE